MSADGTGVIDLAVLIAGGVSISDIATLSDQPGGFGPVASAATCWRVLDSIGKRELDTIAAARAARQT